MANKAAHGNVVTIAATSILCMLCARPQLAAGGCPVDCGAELTHTNSVYSAVTDAGLPTAGPKLPAISSSATRAYGALGSCSNSAGAGFDGGEIVVGATIPMSGPLSRVRYGKILRHSIEIFLEWLNLERHIPSQNLVGGLMVGGRRYSMRFVWTDDGAEKSQAAAAIAHSIRREDAHFGWAGYGSPVSRLQAEQTELDGVLLMAPAGADPRVYAGRKLTFGALPPDYSYLQNSLRAAAQAATGTVRRTAHGDQHIPAVGSLKVGLAYHANLEGMCEQIPALAQRLGMAVAPSPWLDNELRTGAPKEVDSVLRRLRDDGVNFVVGCVYHDLGEAIIEGLERLDYTVHAAAFTSTVDNSFYQTRVDNGWWQGEYALGVTPWHSSLAQRGGFSNMTSAEFLQRYHTRYSELPSYHGPASFAVACALAAAIENASSLNASDVAASLRRLTLHEFGFGTPMNFSGANGQNSPEMLVVQYPPVTGNDLKIVYPRGVTSASSGVIHFPMPPWGKRRCINLGSGVKYGDQLDRARLMSECSGHGTCVFGSTHSHYQVYTCRCDEDAKGKWSGKGCDAYIHHPSPPSVVTWPVIIVSVLVVVAVFSAILVFQTKKHRKGKQVLRDKERIMMENAEQNLKKALAEQKNKLENAMETMDYPETWDMAADDDQILVDVPAGTDEYWEVFTELRRRPAGHPLPAAQAEGADTEGMTDGWLSDLKRIQNKHLYTYYDFQRQRLARSCVAAEGDEVPSVRCWHGTGTFPSENIYTDKQDGFMMQFASKGQFGLGIYFAECSYYSDSYATKADSQRQLAPDEREFMLCSLLVGDCIEMDRDISAGMKAACRELRTPPYLNQTTRTERTPDDRTGFNVPRLVAPPDGGSRDKYNTVRGYTQTDKRAADGTWSKNEECPRSRVWSVFENGRAYPEYLVRYYRGARDPARTPYAAPARPGPGGLPVQQQGEHAHRAAPAPPVQQQQPAPVARPPSPATAAQQQPQQFGPGVQWTCVCEAADGTPQEIPYNAGIRDRFEAEYSKRSAAQVAHVDFTGHREMAYRANVLAMYQEHRQTGTQRQMRRYVDGQLSRWIAVYDEGYRRHYFFNRETNETSWLPNPLCPAPPDQPLAAAAAGSVLNPLGAAASGDA
jgi:hypothetical protein